MYDIYMSSMSSTSDNVTVNLKSAEQFRISIADVKKTLSLIRVHINVTIQMFAFPLYIFTTVKEQSFNFS